MKNFKFEIRPMEELLKSRGLQKGGEVQKYIDSEALRLDQPYVPFQDGGLIDSGITGTEIGSGEIVYNAPYARYQYYGKVMVGRAPKQLTSKDLTYNGAPQRGAYFFERMKTDHKDQILAGAKRKAGAR